MGLTEIVSARMRVIDVLTTDSTYQFVAELSKFLPEF
jgi:hypothetical protein